MTPVAHAGEREFSFTDWSPCSSHHALGLLSHLSPKEEGWAVGRKGVEGSSGEQLD